jgi:hypothetical protein
MTLRNFDDLDDDDFASHADVYETPPDNLSILISEIKQLPPESVIFLYDYLLSLMPPVDVQQIDVNTLIANQLRSAQALQSVTLASQFIPANQKAQTLNATTSVIEKLVKLQVEAYNIETMKALERAIVTTFRSYPNGSEMYEDFKQNYERAKPSPT